MTINTYVQKLSVNSHTTEDFFAYLTRAYKVVQDKIFKQYITINSDQHNDNMNHMTASEGMQAAKSMCDGMSKVGEWIKQDETSACALTAQLEQIDLLNKKLQKKIKDNKLNDKDNRTKRLKEF